MVNYESSIIDAIGGYFELAELEKGEFPLSDGILLNSGRNALEYILRSIGKVNRVYIPFYTCEVVLEPIRKLCISWTCYHITSALEIDEDLSPAEGEYIIANNYFGIKDAYIQQLAERYGHHLIVDCAQALFAKTIPGIKVFYSTRKYVGVADGGVAYLGDDCRYPVTVKEADCTNNHDSHLYLRKQFGAEAGYNEFKNNEIKLSNQPIRWMSDKTRDILEHIDYDSIQKKRNSNFAILHESLNVFNHLTISDWHSFSCPMLYPLFTQDAQSLRQHLIAHKIYVAKYWPVMPFLLNQSLEWTLVEGIVPIPCDQRYGENEMNYIITNILTWYEKKNHHFRSDR
ncbi:MAG: hypothetical protein IJJ72_03780 [Bacteroidales bacterium]|nr:hypothetical protein [Bacteroidales bacterium]